MISNPVFGDYENLGLTIIGGCQQITDWCAHKGYNLKIGGYGIPQSAGTPTQFPWNPATPIFLQWGAIDMFVGFMKQYDQPQFSGELGAQPVFDPRMKEMTNMLRDLWALHVWIYGSYWGDTQKLAGGQILGNNSKGLFTELGAFSQLLPGVQAGIKSHIELAWMSQLGMVKLPDEPQFKGWRCFGKNPFNGSLLSIGASGGARNASDITWHPRYGLLIPDAAIVPDIDREGTAFEGVVIAMLIAMTIYAGGYAAGVWGDGAAAAAVPAGGEAAAGGGSVVTSTDVATSYAVVDTTSMTGISVTNITAATPYLEYAGYASTASSLVNSGGSGADAATTATQQMPATINDNATLTDTMSKLGTVANLKDAASAATALNTIYKVVKNPNGTSSLALRNGTATTYGQASQQYAGGSSDIASSLGSFLPYIAIGLAVILGTS